MDSHITVKINFYFYIAFLFIIHQYCDSSYYYYHYYYFLHLVKLFQVYYIIPCVCVEGWH